MDLDSKKNRKKFSVKDRVKSVAHAWRGLCLFLKTTHNAWCQILFSFLAICISIILRISDMEWVMIVFAIGLVFVAEAFNTAIEIDIDLTSPEYHPYAKDTKDVAAGAVLLSAFTAIIIGLIIFLPKVL